MKDCVFCKIQRDEIQAAKIYENDDVLAFLDIAPVNKGHVLIIPKKHHESLSTVPSEVQQQILETAGKIGMALIRGCDYDGYNLQLNHGECAGQAVSHTHMHIIPRVGTDGFHWNWRSLTYEENEAAEISAKIISRLKI